MTSSPVSQKPDSTSPTGAFDLRNVIAALLGIYGVVLIGCYFFLDPGIDPETGALKAATDNLWTGLALLATAVVFAAWAKLRPIVVSDAAAAESAVEAEPHPKH
ncbi:hypothetical protein ACEE23_09585 [Corynebacterium sp. 32222D000AT]